MHGITRAAITKAQGGRWSSGFWSGFASSGFSVGTKDYGGFVGRTAIMGIVGGTVSEIRKRGQAPFSLYFYRKCNFIFFYR